VIDFAPLLAEAIMLALVLVAIGVAGNVENLGLETTAVRVERGFVHTLVKHVWLGALFGRAHLGVVTAEHLRDF
jgi:hypothetical protein